MLRKQLRKRRRILRELVRQYRIYVDKAATGSLRISTSRRTTSFFQYLASTEQRKLDKNRDVKLITELAWKDYLIKVIPVAEIEIELIESLLKMEDNQSLAMIYENLHPERKKLVKNIEETREASLKRWLEEKIPESELRSGNYYIPTNRGEMVRSKAEYKIANALFNAGIPYKYEVPYRSKNGREILPDFQVRNKNTGELFYWEHFGMMDDSGYVKNSFMYKIMVFAEDDIYIGKGLIATFSGWDYDLNPKTIDSIIRQFLL